MLRYYLFALLLLIGLFFIVTENRQSVKEENNLISFSHELHVDEYDISCQYCHSGVRKGRYAGIPSLQTCMGCHSIIAAESEAIEELRDRVENQEQITWKRATYVGDFTFFNHREHFKKGISCVECHGSTAEIDSKSPPAEIRKMTSCIDCHRQYEATMDCLACHR